ncbi:DUF2971 domain-containing protein [Vibrio parahaemolyticus]|nr:DUF2971 domain-containing protein [Vibrio parahaemolyticus]EJU8968761.1 DUF2971 domain-containing protein [Vibrio parahaemolyticus]
MNLYHYTDQNGFIGIFNNKELWATKIQYLNDHNEYYLAIEIASKEIKALMEKEQDLETKCVYQEFLSRIELISNINLCVCSLSENGDLLSQWRGYSNKMGGYSVGFKLNEIKLIAKRNKFDLLKCIYDEEEQKKKVVSVIKKAISFVDKDGGCKENKHCIDYFEEGIIKLAPIIKDKNFSEESEWRLVKIVSTSDMKFRAGNSMLTPYVGFSLGDKRQVKEVLDTVIVGHTPHVQLAIQATKTFLCNSLLEKSDYPIGLNPFNIVESKIPYRSW